MPKTKNLTLEQRERVCREVLGWKRNPGYTTADPNWPWVSDGVGKTSEPYFDCWHDFGLIVEAMREKGFWFTASADDSGTYEIGFGDNEGRWAWEYKHENLTVAAALAALKALEASK